MGTAHDWMKVLFSGGLWGSMMLVFAMFEMKPGVAKSWALRVPVYALGGLLVGVLTTFRFVQAFRWPLVAVTVSAFAGMIVVGLIYRRRIVQTSR